MSGTPAVKTDIIDEANQATDATWQQIVERQVRALRFGSVQITVHDGRVVQIETSVKVRFDKP